MRSRCPRRMGASARPLFGWSELVADSDRRWAVPGRAVGRVRNYVAVTKRSGVNVVPFTVACTDTLATLGIFTSTATVP